MLRLSRKVDYGLAFLTELAGHSKEWVSLSSVSKDRKISAKFLSQLAVSLRGAGLITSREGINGGYRLTKGPSSIRIKEVVDALEGKMALVDCLSHDEGRCPVEGVCVQRSMWSVVQDQFEGILSKVSLADLARSKKKWE